MSMSYGASDANVSTVEGDAWSSPASMSRSRVAACVPAVERQVSPYSNAECRLGHLSLGQAYPNDLHGLYLFQR